MELARWRAQEDHFILSNSNQPAGKDLSLSGLDPVPLSKMRTHLLASLGSKRKIGTLLLASEMPVPIPRYSTVT